MADNNTHNQKQADNNVPQSHMAVAQLLTLIIKGELDPKKLSTQQLWICLRTLLDDRRHSPQEIARLLKLHHSTVYRHRKNMIRDHGHLLTDLDERQIAIRLIIDADVASARLFRKGKEKEAFEVTKGLIHTLQDLGYLHRRPLEIEGHMTIQEFLRRAAPTIDATAERYKEDGETDRKQITADSGQTETGQADEAGASLG